MPHLSIFPNDTIEMDNLTEELMIKVPDGHFVIWGNPGSFSVSVNYSEWDAYKKGFKLGQKFKKKKNIKETRAYLNAWKRRSQDSNEKLYEKYLLFEGFVEGYTTKNMNILAADNWPHVRDRLDEAIDYALDLTVKIDF